MTNYFIENEHQCSKTIRIHTRTRVYKNVCEQILRYFRIRVKKYSIHVIIAQSSINYIVRVHLQWHNIIRECASFSTTKIYNVVWQSRLSTRGVGSRYGSVRSARRPREPFDFSAFGGPRVKAEHGFEIHRNNSGCTRKIMRARYCPVKKSKSRLLRKSI